MKMRKKHIKSGNWRYGRRAPKPFEKWLAERGLIGDAGRASPD